MGLMTSFNTIISKREKPANDLEAVKQNGRALEYVREQTPELCMEAVKQNGRALRFVQTEFISECEKYLKN